MSKYRIIADPTHGYMRVDPLPSQEEVEKYYEDEFYSSEYKRFNDSSLDVQKEEIDFFNSRWESIYTSCTEHMGSLNGCSLFDIGFGFAQALLYFRQKGLEVSGLEPSPEGVEYARSQGLEVFQAGIENFECVGNRRYDIVTMLNVLEHLRDPAETLVNIRKKLLKSDGILVIDVPNEFNDFQTVADQEYKLNQWWVCAPIHLNYFSVDSLRKLVVECGYEVIYSESSFPLEMLLLMGDVYVGNFELGRLCHQRRVNFEYLMRKHGKGDKLRKFYKCLADLGLGRQVIVYATPRV